MLNHIGLYRQEVFPLSAVCLYAFVCVCVRVCLYGWVCACLCVFVCDFSIFLLLSLSLALFIWIFWSWMFCLLGMVSLEQRVRTVCHDEAPYVAYLLI